MFVERLLQVHHGGLPITSLDFQPHAAPWDLERLATAAANCVKIWALHSHSPALVRSLLNTKAAGEDSGGPPGSQKRRKCEASPPASPPPATPGGDAPPSVAKEDGAEALRAASASSVLPSAASAPNREPPALSRPPLTVAACVWTAAEHRSEITTLRWAPTGEYLATCDAEGNLFIYALNLPSTPSPLPEKKGKNARQDATSLAFSCASSSRSAGVPCLCPSFYPSPCAAPWLKPARPGASGQASSAGVYAEKWRQVSACLCSAVGHVFDMCWCHDSRTVALAGGSGKIALVDIRRQEITTVVALPDGESGMVKGVAWDPQASLLAAHTSEKKVFVWRTQRRAGAGKKAGDKTAWSCSLVFQHDDLLQGGQPDTPGPRRLSWHPQGTFLALPFAERNGRVFGCCLRVQDDAAPASEGFEAETASRNGMPDTLSPGTAHKSKQSASDTAKSVFSSEPPLRLRGHRRPIRIVRFSPDLLVMRGSASEGAQGEKWRSKGAGASADEKRLQTDLCCLYAQASLDGALSIWQFSPGSAAQSSSKSASCASSGSGAGEKKEEQGRAPADKSQMRCLAVLVNFLDENSTLQDIAWGRHGQWLAAACTGGAVTLISLPHDAMQVNFATNWLAFQLSSSGPGVADSTEAAVASSSLSPAESQASPACGAQPPGAAASSRASAALASRLRDPPSPGSEEAFASAVSFSQEKDGRPVCACACKCCCCVLHRHFAFAPCSPPPPAASSVSSLADTNGQAACVKADSFASASSAACAAAAAARRGRGDKKEDEDRRKVGAMQVESVTAGGKRRIRPVQLTGQQGAAGLAIRNGEGAAASGLRIESARAHGDKDNASETDAKKAKQDKTSSVSAPATKLPAVPPASSAFCSALSASLQTFLASGEDRPTHVAASPLPSFPSVLPSPPPPAGSAASGAPSAGGSSFSARSAAADAGAGLQDDDGSDFLLMLQRQGEEVQRALQGTPRPLAKSLPSSSPSSPTAGVPSAPPSSLRPPYETALSPQGRQPGLPVSLADVFAGGGGGAAASGAPAAGQGCAAEERKESEADRERPKDRSARCASHFLSQVLVARRGQPSAQPPLSSLPSKSGVWATPSVSFVTASPAASESGAAPSHPSAAPASSLSGAKLALSAPAAFLASHRQEAMRLQPGAGPHGGGAAASEESAQGGFLSGVPSVASRALLTAAPSLHQAFPGVQGPVYSLGSPRAALSASWEGSLALPSGRASNDGGTVLLSSSHGSGTAVLRAQPVPVLPPHIKAPVLPSVSAAAAPPLSGSRASPAVATSLVRGALSHAAALGLAEAAAAHSSAVSPALLRDTNAACLARSRSASLPPQPPCSPQPLVASGQPAAAAASFPQFPSLLPPAPPGASPRASCGAERRRIASTDAGGALYADSALHFSLLQQVKQMLATHSAGAVATGASADAGQRCEGREMESRADLRQETQPVCHSRLLRTAPMANASPLAALRREARAEPEARHARADAPCCAALPAGERRLSPSVVALAISPEAPREALPSPETSAQQREWELASQNFWRATREMRQVAKENEKRQADVRSGQGTPATQQRLSAEGTPASWLAAGRPAGAAPGGGGEGERAGAHAETAPGAEEDREEKRAPALRLTKDYVCGWTPPEWLRNAQLGRRGGGGGFERANARWARVEKGVGEEGGEAEREAEVSHEGRRDGVGDHANEWAARNIWEQEGREERPEESCEEACEREHRQKRGDTRGDLLATDATQRDRAPFRPPFAAILSELAKFDVPPDLELCEDLFAPLSTRQPTDNEDGDEEEERLPVRTTSEIVCGCEPPVAVASRLCFVEFAQDAEIRRKQHRDAASSRALNVKSGQGGEGRNDQGPGQEGRPAFVCAAAPASQEGRGWGASGGRGEASGERAREMSRAGHEARGRGRGTVGGGLNGGDDGDDDDDDAEARERALRKNAFAASLCNGVTSKADGGGRGGGEGERDEDGKKKGRQAACELSSAGDQAGSSPSSLKNGASEEGWGSWNPFKRRLHLLRQLGEEEEEEDDEEDEGPVRTDAKADALASSAAGNVGIPPLSTSSSCSASAPGLGSAAPWGPQRQEGDRCARDGESLGPALPSAASFAESRKRNGDRCRSSSTAEQRVATDDGYGQKDAGDHQRRNGVCFLDSKSSVSTSPPHSSPSVSKHTDFRRVNASSSGGVYAERKEACRNEGEREPENESGQESAGSRGDRGGRKRPGSQERRSRGGQRRDRRSSGGSGRREERRGAKRTNFRASFASWEQERESETGTDDSNSSRSSCLSSLSDEDRMKRGERPARFKARGRDPGRGARGPTSTKRGRRGDRQERADRWREGGYETDEEGDQEGDLRRQERHGGKRASASLKRKGVTARGPPLVSLPALRKRLRISTTVNGTPVGVVAFNALRSGDGDGGPFSLFPSAVSAFLASERGRQGEDSREDEAWLRCAGREAGQEGTGRDGALLCCSAIRKKSRRGEGRDSLPDDARRAEGETAHETDEKERPHLRPPARAKWVGGEPGVPSSAAAASGVGGLFILIDIATGALRVSSLGDLSLPVDEPFCVCRYVTVKRDGASRKSARASSNGRASPSALSLDYAATGGGAAAAADEQGGAVCAERSSARCGDASGSEKSVLEALEGNGEREEETGSGHCLLVLTVYAKLYVLQLRDDVAPPPGASSGVSPWPLAFFAAAGACGEDSSARPQRRADDDERCFAGFSRLPFCPRSPGWVTRGLGGLRCAASPPARGAWKTRLGASPLSSPLLSFAEAPVFCHLVYFADLAPLCESQEGGDGDAADSAEPQPLGWMASCAGGAHQARSGSAGKDASVASKIAWVEIRHRPASLTALLGRHAASVEHDTRSETRKRGRAAADEDEQRRGSGGVADAERGRGAVRALLRQVFGAEGAQDWIQVVVGFASGRICASLPPAPYGGALAAGLAPLSPAALSSGRQLTAAVSASEEARRHGGDAWVAGKRGLASTLREEGAALLGGSLDREKDRRAGGSEFPSERQACRGGGAGHRGQWPCNGEDDSLESGRDLTFVRIDDLSFQQSDFFSILSWKHRLPVFSPGGERDGSATEAQEARGVDARSADLAAAEAPGGASREARASARASGSAVRAPGLAGGEARAAESDPHGDGSSEAPLREQVQKAVAAQQGALFSFLLQGRVLGSHFAALLGATPQDLAAMRRKTMDELLSRGEPEGRGGDAPEEEQEEGDAGEMGAAEEMATQRGEGDASKNQPADKDAEKEKSKTEGEEDQEVRRELERKPYRGVVATKPIVLSEDEDKSQGRPAHLKSRGNDTPTSEEDEMRRAEPGAARGAAFREGAVDGEKDAGDLQMPSQRQTVEHLEQQVKRALLLGSSSDFLYWLAALLRRQCELLLLPQLRAAARFFFNAHLAWLRRLLAGLKEAERAVSLELQSALRALTRLRKAAPSSRESAPFFLSESPLEGGDAWSVERDDETEEERWNCDGSGSGPTSALVDWRLLASLRLSAEEAGHQILRVLSAIKRDEQARSCLPGCKGAETRFHEDEEGVSRARSERMQALAQAETDVEEAAAAIARTQKEIESAVASLESRREERKSVLLLVGEGTVEQRRREKKMRKTCAGSLFSYLSASDQEDEAEKEATRRAEAEAFMEDIF
ncbi:hypothetical protein BESB_005140 [Besnoitia besnoiti]|uniref:WD domain, G-beta repeat-containing protein n=1 Tax=Besnoitia besnoiti TaxID=94643 RepID=A0A2A9MPX6_BESBE|nr:hypothetical protein BESB_005140 [Besnoitia besnoiti]PFH38173.1 hypothetical protein BESB_005140 [Besnoitia besnoiti]